MNISSKVLCRIAYILKVKQFVCLFTYKIQNNFYLDIQQLIYQFPLVIRQSMKILFVSCIILLMLQVVNTQMQTPQRVAWANVWTQSFIYSGIEDMQTVGTYWYNWNKKSVKLSFQNGDKSFCLFFSSYSSECQLLVTNSTMYLIYPSKKVCGALDYDVDISSPSQAVEGSIYDNTTIIGGVSYYFWHFQDDPDFQYATTVDSTQITYLEVTNNSLNSTYYYIVPSYTPSIDNKVFSLPSYCKNNHPDLQFDHSKVQKQFKKIKFLEFKRKNSNFKKQISTD